MSLIDRSAFLDKGRGFKREQITIEGIGDAYVKEVSAGDAAAYAKKVGAGGDNVRASAWLVIRVLCAEDGTPILTDADTDALCAMPLRVLKTITETAERLSGLSEAAKKNAAQS